MLFSSLLTSLPFPDLLVLLNLSKYDYQPTGNFILLSQKCFSPTATIFPPKQKFSILHYAIIWCNRCGDYTIKWKLISIFISFLIKKSQGMQRKSSISNIIAGMTGWSTICFSVEHNKMITSFEDELIRYRKTYSKMQILRYAILLIYSFLINSDNSELINNDTKLEKKDRKCVKSKWGTLWIKSKLKL